MLFVYARTREREKAWKLSALCFGVAAVGAPLVMLIFRRKFDGFIEVYFRISFLQAAAKYESIS